jgi:hypothetical protein
MTMLSTRGTTMATRRAPRAALLGAVGLLAVAGAGCGGSDKKDDGLTKDQQATDKAAITDVLGELQAASRAGDGDRVCTQIFTPKLADSVTKSSSSGSCATEVKAKLFSPSTKLTVQNVTVTDPVNATATIKEANGNVSTVFFVKQSGRWRMRSVQPA